MENVIIAGVMAAIVFSVIAFGAALVYAMKNRGRNVTHDAWVSEGGRFFGPDSTIDKPLFFQNEQKSGKTVKFYASAPSMNIEIPSDRAIDCDYDEICAYVDCLYENTADNFFTLENERSDCIQFFHDGISPTIEIDVPVPDMDGSHKGEFSSLKEVKTVIDSFLNNIDITVAYPLRFEKW